MQSTMLCAVALVPWGLWTQPVDAQEEPPPAEVHEIEALAARLESVVLDESRTPGERAEAAALLGKLGTGRSLRFLASHMHLEVRKKVLGSYLDRMDHKPCLYGLLSSSWNATPFILDYLENAPRAREQKLYIAAIFARFPGRDAAAALLRERLQNPRLDDEHDAAARALGSPSMTHLASNHFVIDTVTTPDVHGR